jgi:subtilisin family serine protease
MRHLLSLLLACSALAVEPLQNYNATNRVAFFQNPSLYAIDGYEWHIKNTGQPSKLYKGGVYDSQEPGGTWDARIQDAWAIQPNGIGCTIGIVDSGCQTNHIDLSNVVVQQVRYFGTNLQPSVLPDRTGHGTELTGIIAANMNGLGVAGVAPGCKVKHVQTQYDPAEMAAGILWCITNGCDAIVLAWGESANDSLLSNACWRACSNGIPIFAAVPDLAQNIDIVPDYPSSWGLIGVLPVTAWISTGVIFDSAGYGTNVMGAPGRRIVSVDYRGGYAYYSGTSPASAVAAGVFALLKAKYPNQSGIALLQAMRHAGAAINALDALNAPIPSITAGPDYVVVHGLTDFAYELQWSADMTVWMDIGLTFGESSFQVFPSGFYRALIL